MHPSLVEQLQKFISENQVEKALALLQKGEDVPDLVRVEAVSLSGRLQQIKQQERKGIISHENAILEWNKIRDALMQIIHFYAKSPEERALIARQRKKKWLVLLVLYVGVTGGLIVWLFRPQPSYRIAAELMVERVSFQYLEGPANFARGKVISCFIQNFASVELEGDRLLWDKTSDNQWNAHQILTSSLAFKSDENIPGIGMHFGPAQLERLYPAPGALLTFSQSEDDPSFIQATIQQQEALRSEWTFQDSLDLEVEMVTLDGVPGLTFIYTPTQMRVYPPSGKAREMKITSFPGTSSLDMHFDSDFLVEGKNLLIAELNFYQPLESVAVPTLLAGRIQIGQLDKKPLKTIAISEGEALDVFSDEPLSLQKISFEEHGIAIQFSGLVQEIETGRNHESRSPSRMEWWWHSQKWLVSALLTATLGLVLFLLDSLRKKPSGMLKEYG